MHFYIEIFASKMQTLDVAGLFNRSNGLKPNHTAAMLKSSRFKSGKYLGENGNFQRRPSHRCHARR